MATTTIRQVTAWAAVSPPNVTVIRSISGFALQTVAKEAAVRKFGGYALLKVVSAATFATSGPASLLAQINKEQNLSLVATDLTFAAPGVLANDSSYNTNIVLTAKNTAAYIGSMTVRYNRYPLNLAFNGKGSALPSDTATTLVGRLPAINTAFGLALVAADIVDGAVAANATTLTLTIAAASVLFLPGSTMTLGS